MDHELLAFKTWLKKTGITPVKAKGQHFLWDAEVLDEIIAVADLAKGDRVLEIGPGLGWLTQRLAANATEVIAVELDEQFRPSLARLESRFPRLHVLWMDVLRMDIPQVMGEAPYHLVANLPYLISSRIFKLFLSSSVRPLTMTVLVQKEVGERICAKPGKHSLLSLSVQFYGEPLCDAVIPAKAFYPQPAVDSIILKVENIGLHHPEIKDVDRFFRLLHIGFSAKRKQLQNNLANGLRQSRQHLLQVFQRLDLASTVRAQELSLEQWKRLYCLLQG